MGYSGTNNTDKLHLTLQTRLDLAGTYLKMASALPNHE